MKRTVVLVGLLVVAILATGCGGKVYRPEVTAHVKINAPEGHEVIRDGDTYTVRQIAEEETKEEVAEEEEAEGLTSARKLELILEWAAERSSESDGETDGEELSKMDAYMKERNEEIKKVTGLDLEK